MLVRIIKSNDEDKSERLSKIDCSRDLVICGNSDSIIKYKNKQLTIMSTTKYDFDDRNLFIDVPVKISIPPGFIINFECCIKGLNCNIFFEKLFGYIKNDTDIDSNSDHDYEIINKVKAFLIEYSRKLFFENGFKTSSIPEGIPLFELNIIPTIEANKNIERIFLICDHEIYKNDMLSL